MNSSPYMKGFGADHGTSHHRKRHREGLPSTWGGEEAESCGLDAHVLVMAADSRVCPLQSALAPLEYILFRSCCYGYS